MSIPSDVSDALSDARILAEMGVPLFTARLKPNGDPLPPNGWERTRPSVAVANRFRPSRQSALCAVTGIEFDVLDIDPRNGGDKSIQQLSETLGENGPEIYWRVKTPSGGMHLYIARLGIGTHTGFMPGLDLKGGREDGSSRGFVFLPPTIRPSKVTGKLGTYRGTSDSGPSDAEPKRCHALAAYIEEHNATGRDFAGAFRRNPPNSLRQACLDAEAGDQRNALLRYVHELERRGYEREDIISVVMGLTLEMPCYNSSRPWTEKDIRGLLHHSGRVIPDAAPGELDGLEGPITAGLVRSMAELSPERISWLWPGYLAFREFTIMDGEKGNGKSFIVDDWAARASRGQPMPGSEFSTEPISVIIFTDEGHLESTTLPRLMAAGADLKRVFAPKLGKPKRAKGNSEWELALPHGAAMMEKMIRESDAQLAIWDPITDFLGEDINSHNDASVRRALRPLNAVLNKTMCAGLGIRHLNKDTKQDMKFRGSGSSAFQNRARVHLVAARLPPGRSETSMFGLGQIDINISKKNTQVLAYAIEDSELRADDAEGYVGRVNWEGYTDITTDELGKADPRPHGPSPVRREEVEDVLRDMFNDRTTWEVEDARRQLKQAGVSTSQHTVDKARRALGIYARAIFHEGGTGIERWVWTTEARKEKVKKRGKVDNGE